MSPGLDQVRAAGTTAKFLVNPQRMKRPRVRLDPRSYRRLWKRILERDAWRCQHCGSWRNLQVHHIQSRGQLGNDEENNLLTLCADCHGRVHGQISLES